MNLYLLLLFATLLCSGYLNAQDYEKANHLFEVGRYHEAALEYEKVIPWLEKEYGQTDTAALPLYNYLLGASYFLSGDLNNAESQLLANVAFCQKYCDYINPYEITSHDYLATLYSEQGNYLKLIDERKKIVQLHESKSYQKKGLINIAYAYNDLGIAYYTSAMDKEAIQAYTKAIDLFKKSGSDNYLDGAIMQINLAYSHLYNQDFESAETHYYKGFESIYKLHPKDYFGQTSTFRTEGINLINSKEYKLAQKALQIDAKTKSEVITPLDTSLIETYIYLGQAYHYDNQPQEAKKTFDKIPSILEKQFTKSESDRAFWYNYLAGMYDLIGEKQTALEYYESSVPYYTSVQSTTPYGLVITATNIVRLANDLGNYEKAIKYGEIKLGFYDKNFSKSDASVYQAYMNSVFDLAILYMQTLQMDKAEAIILSAYKKDPNISSYPDLHVNLQDKLFDIYNATGQPEKGHALIDEELEFIAANYGKEDLYYITMVGKALLYSQKGENLKAMELFVDIYPHFKGRNDYNEANILNNQGMCYIELGNYVKAEKKYFESLKIHQSIDTNTKHYIAALGNLGRLYFDQSAYDKSIHFYERSKLITENILGKASQEYVSIVNSMANVMLYSQQFDKAVVYYEESLKYIEQVFSKDHPIVLDLLGNVGHSLCALQMFDEGVKILENVSERSVKIMGKASYKTLHYKTNLAMAYHATDKKEAAKQEMLNLLFNIDKNVNYNLKYMNESASLALLNKMNLYYSSIYSYLYDKNKDDQIVEACFNSTLKNKGKLLESNTALKNQVARTKNARLIETYEQWVDKVKTLSNLQSSGTSIDLDILDQTQEEAEELEETLMMLSTDFANKMTKDYDWKQIQERLKDQEIIIEFLRIEHQQKFIKDTIQYGAFVLDKKMDHPLFIPVCNEFELKKLLGEVAANNLNYIQQVYGKSNEKSKLHDLIIRPITPYLQGKTKVYISPDGLLHKVAFPAISDGNQYFGGLFEVKIINSGSALLDEASNTIEILKPLLIGGVDYNKNGESEEIWKYLSGTKTEVSGISDLLKQQKISISLLTGQDATEENFSDEINNVNMIHIATHGFFYPEPSLTQQVVLQETKNVEDISFRGGTSGTGYNYYVTNNDPMMRSGIALSGANQIWNQSDIPLSKDGVLTALDFSLMDLQHIDLVVLSACETGLGDIKGSEGVYGLQRSLKLAGARNIVMSLWQVPDQETKEFMLYFYQELMNSRNIEAAFIKTQRAMSKKYDPYYWGAFILL